MSSAAERFRAEVHTPERFPWDEIGSTILAIEEEAFAPNNTGECWFKKTLEHPRTTAVMLTDDSEIAGFSIAFPIGKVFPWRFLSNRTTAFVAPTVIRPEYRKQGLLPKLLGTLDEELRKKGYSYVERHAEVRNGYAATLMKVYGEQVVYSADRRSAIDRRPLKVLRMSLH